VEKPNSQLSSEPGSHHLVCAPCCHGKMIATFHSPVNTVMTEHPGQLLHMDIVGPSRVRSMGGKWYVLVIVDDYYRYSCVFFLESKDQVFEHFQLLALRLNNEYLNCLKAIHSDNGTEFRNVSFDEFCLEHDNDQQFSARAFLNKMELWNERTAL
jgi:transposase InsO family protein